MTLLLIDPRNMFRVAQIQGQLVEATTDGAEAHIDRLSRRYTGNPYQYRRPGVQRVVLKVEPLRITGSIDGWG